MQIQTSHFFLVCRTIFLTLNSLKSCVTYRFKGKIVYIHDMLISPTFQFATYDSICQIGSLLYNVCSTSSTLVQQVQMFSVCWDVNSLILHHICHSNKFIYRVKFAIGNRSGIYSIIWNGVGSSFGLTNQHR